ncbi:hypothetical protein KI688_005382 [Linnemannia hyalina]|uniref:Uncharacterized protein n=1 Tax=Linnemannia hyalina TaxID=64524 RepID=A0A9P7XKY4_9FUNG|nr:hypothetical protein KI688_005382 [Linnemannia hyalina]
MADSTLRRKRLLQFFDSVEPRYWHDIRRFYQHRDTSLTCEQNFQAFQAALHKIQSFPPTSPEDKRKSFATRVLHNVTLEKFQRSFNLMVDNEMLESARTNVKRTLYNVIDQGTKSASEESASVTESTLVDSAKEAASVEHFNKKFKMGAFENELGSTTSLEDFFQPSRSASSQTSCDSVDFQEVIEKLLTHPTEKMGVLLGRHEFEFTATVEGVDVGMLFQDYYRRCSLDSFKAATPQDALALNGTLVLSPKPTAIQDLVFGAAYETIRAEALSLVPKADVTKERACIRRWRDAYEDSDQDREKVLDLLEASNQESAKQLHRYMVRAFAELGTHQDPLYSEAHGIATNNASTSSVFKRKLLDMETKTCGQPDITVRTKAGLETCYAEVSGITCRDVTKQAGDLVRLGVFSKNAWDRIDSEHDYQGGIVVLQVMGRRLTGYVLRNLGNFYAMVEVGTAKVPDSLESLVDLEGAVTLLRRLGMIHDELLSQLQERPRVAKMFKNHFPSIATPSAKTAL